MGMSSSFTRDDAMLGDMYLQAQTQKAFALTPCHYQQSAEEWLPLVSLRHMAQQIMIRNISETPRGTRHLDLHRISLSSSSSDSSLPASPLWVEEELHRERALSHVGDSLFAQDLAPVRQRAASFHSTCQPIRRNIDSSLKAAKLLGIEALSGAPRRKPKPAPTITSLKQLVDSKMRLFRRTVSCQGGASLKSITKDTNLQLMDYVDVQRRAKGNFRPRKTWSKLFVVLSDSTLHCFQDKHTGATDELVIRESTVVCVSNLFAGQAFVLEVIDGTRSWFLRFDNKTSLATWMAKIRNSSRIHHRHTAPASPFHQTLEQVPEYA